MNSPDWPDHVRWLSREAFRLLDFGRASAQAANGFAWLDDAGAPDLEGPLDLWITARMTHVYSLGALMGYPGAEELIDHGLAALNGPFFDREHSGWYAQIAADGTPTDLAKGAYAHAFVLLAASSATAASRPGADDLLKRAFEVQDSHFWEPNDGMVIDVFNREFTAADPYRGVNANMHIVEAYLAGADVSGEARWRDRALGIIERVVGEAADTDWRIPEHYTTDWRPLLDHNVNRPKDQFRPYGATPGHGFEWSRLILEAAAALGAGAPDWMRPAAEELFRRAYADGWTEEPTRGFIYTTNWEGQPVIDARLHWVAAEAVAAAITAFRATGDPLYQHLYGRWWNLIEERFIDRDLGSWHHEVDPSGAVGASLWEGKPDVYHAVQATLIPRLPLAPSLASALRADLLDQV
ncbi:MAG: AGE family epimerase/isomerase [Bifidobacteriaceae bacterium]|jgi:mannose/cellobiose epimerase-like protein (N-acyl-D-glucosamine 2-epimerase family)|nr:AGE family epimerase/isomerase [Bifidobacteriaceae bacterium]